MFNFFFTKLMKKNLLFKNVWKEKTKKKKKNWIQKQTLMYINRYKASAGNVM